jgi:hypothetical protein
MENFDLAIITQMIADHLQGWSWERHDKVYLQDSLQVLVGPDGAKLDLHYDKRHSRLSIGGVYPFDGNSVYPWNDKDRPTDITVSASRQPSVIAREVERRFLPAYLAAYRKGLEQFTKAKAHKQSKEELALKLARLCGEDQRLRGFEFSHYGAESMWLGVRVDGPNLVKVSIESLPAQKAEEVLKVLLAPGPTPQSKVV